MTPKRSARIRWLVGTTVLLALGVLIGLILQNVWLGIILAVVFSIVWLIAVESASGGNAGLEDEDRGIEL